MTNRGEYRNRNRPSVEKGGVKTGRRRRVKRAKTSDCSAERKPALDRGGDP